MRSVKNEENNYNSEQVSIIDLQKVLESSWIKESSAQKEINKIDTKHKIKRKNRHNIMFSILEWFFVAIFLICITIVIIISLIQNFGFLRNDKITDFSFLLLDFVKLGIGGLVGFFFSIIKKDTEK